MPVQPPNRHNFPAGMNGTRRYNQAVIQFQAALRAESSAKLGYVALYHSSSKNETMALHRAGCADIERDRERHGSNLQAFEAENLAAALEVVIDDELREMGYDHDSVRVYPCVTRTEPKEGTMAKATVLDPTDASGADGANGATDRKPRRRSASKSAPASARKATTSKAAATVRKSLPKAKATPKKATAAKSDGVDFSAKSVRNRIVKEHEAGSTIKEIAEGLGLPAVHASWFRVSKVWREEADARGLKRPRRSAK